MNERSFIAREIRDPIGRTEFEPFEIALVDGRKLVVGTPETITTLSAGVVVYVSDGTRMTIPYDKIVSLQLVFEL